LQVDGYEYEIKERIFLFDDEVGWSAGVHEEQPQQSTYDRDYAAAQKTNQ